MRSAASEKEAGDRSYRARHMAEALQHYTEALRLADSADTTVDVAAVHANRALCYLSTQQHNLALRDCNTALALRPKYCSFLSLCFSLACVLSLAHQTSSLAVKVLIRKAVALEGLGRHAEARACLDAAAQCDGAAQYADTLGPLGVRVDLALAFAHALDTWGDAPDAFDRVRRAFAEETAALAPKYSTASSSSSAAPAAAAEAPRNAPAEAAEAPRKRRRGLFHRLFHDDDSGNNGGA